MLKKYHSTYSSIRQFHIRHDFFNINTENSQKECSASLYKNAFLLTEVLTNFFMMRHVQHSTREFFEMDACILSSGILEFLLQTVQLWSLHQGPHTGTAYSSTRTAVAAAPE